MKESHRGTATMAAALHVHSWYSLLEATASPESLLRRAREGGYKSLALTDVNNLYGVVPFVEAARRLGVRPIVGACLRHGGERAVALAADPAGYRSLCRAISRIQLGSQVAEMEGGAPAEPLLGGGRGSRRAGARGS